MAVAQIIDQESPLSHYRRSLFLARSYRSALPRRRIDRFRNDMLNRNVPNRNVIVRTAAATLPAMERGARKCSSRGAFACWRCLVSPDVPRSSLTAPVPQLLCTHCRRVRASSCQYGPRRSRPMGCCAARCCERHDGRGRRCPPPADGIHCSDGCRIHHLRGADQRVRIPSGRSDHHPARRSHPHWAPRLTTCHMTRRCAT